jgi:LAO/AO transport system kinase
MLAGDQQSLARLITLVENGGSALSEIMEMLQHRPGRILRVGITGPPGSGKSTLIDKLVTRLRDSGLSVGVIAVDPSSPITGGAVLGDRIRMQRHYLDSGVFIRSMATRGSHGGLANAVNAVVKLLEAFGKNAVIIETVGVGQTELAISEIADTVVLVLVPECGDDIQALKAGILEIADIVVVNKADREGADRFVDVLRANLACGGGKAEPVVIAAQAINNIGIEELYQEIDKRWN